jgi:1,4-dihydroxy-2-naphthoyl-CoA hydrolase
LNTEAKATKSIFVSAPSLAALNRLSAQSLSTHLGIEIIDIGDDYLRGRMPVDERTKQPFGLLHGGASVVLAETLGSFAGHLTLTPEFMAVGLEINANHLRSVREGFVIGTARPLHLGSRTHVWEIRIENEAAELICISRLTLAIVPTSGGPDSKRLHP